MRVAVVAVLEVSSVKKIIIVTTRRMMRISGMLAKATIWAPMNSATPLALTAPARLSPPPKRMRIPQGSFVAVSQFIVKVRCLISTGITNSSIAAIMTIPVSVRPASGKTSPPEVENDTFCNSGRQIQLSAVHLTLTDAWVLGERGQDSGGVRATAYDTSTKVNPPLRTQEDVDAVVAALADGTIDLIATDHAPHAQTDKLCTYQDAANGIANLETAFASVLSLHHSDAVGLPVLIKRMTAAPARFLNMDIGSLKAGSAADVTAKLQERFDLSGLAEKAARPDK